MNLNTVCKRLVSIVLALMMLSTMFSTCLAVTAITTGPERASDYFASTRVWCTPMGNGKIIVEFDINAVKRMDRVGAISVIIYEQQSSGSFKEVKTYKSSTTAGMLETNTAFAYSCLWYQGKPGVKYYALVGCYAELNGTGSTLAQYTNTVTAT